MTYERRPGASPFGTSGAVLGLPYTIQGRLANVVSQVGNNNRGFYGMVVEGGTISKVGLHVGTSSGNICVAAWQGSGTGRARVPATRLATSGSVACPATGYQEVSLGASVALVAGDFLFLQADNTTATFGMYSILGGVSSDLNAPWAYRTDPGVFPIGAAPGTLVAQGLTCVLVGVA